VVLIITLRSQFVTSNKNNMFKKLLDHQQLEDKIRGLYIKKSSPTYLSK